MFLDFDHRSASTWHCHESTHSNMCPQKKSLERIAKLEKDQEFLHCEVERVSNEKQVAADLVRKLSSDKKGLIDEKRSFIKENKKLHARIKILEQSVVDHQEVSWERAISAHKLKRATCHFRKGQQAAQTGSSEPRGENFLPLERARRLSFEAFGELQIGSRRCEETWS